MLFHHVVPIPLKHSWYDVLGFRFDTVAYCTDVNEIPDSSWPMLDGLEVLIIDSSSLQAPSRALQSRSGPRSHRPVKAKKGVFDAHGP